MPLATGCCDLCGTPVEVLFPMAVWDKLPTGQERMVEKWVCYHCWKMFMMVLEKGQEIDPEDIIPEE